jgi:ketosteroid isomerase-like protein
MSQRDVELVGRVYEAFVEGMGRREFGLVFERGLVAEEIDWEPFPQLVGSHESHGRQGFIEFMRTWSEDFDDWSLELEELIDAGDGLVLALIRQDAVGHESGVPVDLEFAQLVELHDERVIRIRSFLDREEAKAEAGLLGRAPDPAGE